MEKRPLVRPVLLIAALVAVIVAIAAFCAVSTSIHPAGSKNDGAAATPAVTATATPTPTPTPTPTATPTATPTPEPSSESSESSDEDGSRESTAPEVPSLGELCAQVAQFAESSPAKAIEQIESIRSGAGQSGVATTADELSVACEPERLIALRAAAQLVADAEAASDAGADDEICQRAEKLTAAGEPDKAVKLIDDYGKDSCAAERKEALLAQAKGRDAVQVKADAWKAAIDQWIRPAGELLAGGLTLVVVGLVLARALTFWRWVEHPLDSVRRKRFWWVGLGGIALGAALGTALLSAATLLDCLPEWGRGLTVGVATLLSVFCGISGATLLAIAMAARLAIRISVTKSGELSAADSAELSVRLFELGAAPPRGLEVPRETDSSAQFDKILPSAVGLPFVAVLRQAWGLLVSSTPWVAAVTVNDDGSGSLLLTRNGREVESRSVSFTEHELPVADKAGTRYGLKLIAGLIVAELARKHRSEFDGLCGASDGGSIGLQYIATTEFADWDATGRRYLAAALDLDAENLPALVALKHSLYRDSDHSAELKRYATWLNDLSIQIEKKIEKGDWSPSAYLNLHRRILLTYFVAVRNYRAASGDTSWPEKCDIEERSEALRDLLAKEAEATAGMRETPGSNAYLQRARIRAWSLVKNLSGAVDFLDDWAGPDTLGALQSYNNVCALVVDPDAPLDRLEPQLIEQLTVAFTNPDIKTWGKKDPELAVLRARPGFSKLFDFQTSDQPWSLALFEPLKHKLQAIGIASPQQLADASSQTVRDYLKLSPIEYKHHRRVARLLRIAEEKIGGTPGRLQSLWLEIVREIVDRGLTRPADWPLPPERNAVVKMMAASLETRTGVVVDQAELDKVLHDLGFPADKSQP